MKRVLIVLIILACIAGGIYLAYRNGQLSPDAANRALAQLGLAATSEQAQPAPLTATGIVEAHQVAVSSELGGRITQLRVAEGDTVSAGQPLVSLDDSLLQARVVQADAAIAVAQAQLDLLLAGVRPEEIAQAQAQLAQAEAAAQVAQQAWDDAKLLRANPQDLDLKIIEAETNVAQAEHQAAAAHRLAEAADLQVQVWERVTNLLAEGFDVDLPWGGWVHVDPALKHKEANTQWNLAGQQAWEAWQNAYTADDAAKAAATAVADLRSQRNNPIELDAQVSQAEAAYRRAAAAIDLARAAVQGLEEGATAEQIDVARQAVEQARAARATLDVQLGKTEVVAPRDGLVTQVSVHQGEVALPGAPLLEIADLGKVTLTVYVPEPEMGRVQLGQAAHVTVDSFPGRVFEGSVSRIADQAEFTPKNVQTREQRINTVFAVEITLDNPDSALKPGMPADTTFVES